MVGCIDHLSALSSQTNLVLASSPRSTSIPASTLAEPVASLFKINILSLSTVFVVSIAVAVPVTVKLPPTVKLLEISTLPFISTVPLFGFYSISSSFN